MLVSISHLLHSSKRCLITPNPFIRFLKLTPTITSSPLNFPRNFLHITKNYYNINNDNINSDNLDLNPKYKKELEKLKKTLSKGNDIKISYEYNSVKDQTTTPKTWHTILKTNWPQNQSFEGKSTKKSLSEELAAKQLIDFYKSCLHLEDNNNLLINNNNYINQPLNKQNSHENDLPSPTKNALAENLETSNLTTEEIRNLEIRYPLAKQTIKSIFSQAKTELKKNDSLKIIYSQDRSTYLWKCTIHCWWPHHSVFEAFGKNKTDALNYTSLQILSWLEKQNLINERGVPKFILEKSFIPEINLNEEEFKDIPKVIDKYFNDPPENHQQLRSENNELTENLKSFNLTGEEIANLKIRYPNAKNLVHNLYFKIEKELNKKSTPLNIHYNEIEKGRFSIWKCTINWSWPNTSTFEGFAKTKSDAYNYASLGLLSWLDQQKLITKKCSPLFINNEINNTNFTSDICIKEEDFATIPNIINKYFDEIEECIKEIPEDLESNSTSFAQENEFLQSTHNSTYLKERINEDLLKRAKSNRFSINENLPISKFRNDIISAIKLNRVLVVEGQPGCGKSTQVPQFIFDDLALKGSGSDCRILITQPRRISAVSLAHRIAEERKERVGEIVGYQVRFDSIYPQYREGSIFFCTTGVLLNRLVTDPSLKGISHVIIDEVHERDCNTDMILGLIEQALHLNQDLKLILMSATINTQMFVDFFKRAELTTTSIKLPGFTYPVKSFFINKDDGKIDCLNIHNELKDTEIDFNSLNINLLVKTIKYIHVNRPLNGAILVFLPGWSDISKVMSTLEKMSDSNKLLIVPVHSRLRSRDQRNIFNKPPPGTRKVILATNIAESSITINDVVYVIDSGVHKEYRFSNMGLSILSNHWVSQASVKQRKGRAGRVQSGECFHLYTEDQYNVFDEFPVPEIHRVLLTKIALESKTHAPHIPIESFLQRLPEPPSTEAIKRARNLLIDMEALNEDESLTKLGKILSTFSSDPTISKTLVQAALFRCISPIMTISSILDSDMQIFINDLNNRSNIRMLKAKKDKESDHLAYAHVYEDWANAQRNENEYRTRQICFNNYLNPSVLENVRNYRILFSRNLYQNKLCSTNKEPMVISSPCNQYHHEPELVKAVLYSGLNNLLEHRGKSRFSIISRESRRPANISSESVNFKKNKHSKFYTYYKIINMTDRFGVIHESSSVSPLAVLLFSSGKILSKKVKEEENQDPQEDILELKIARKENLKFYCDRRTCDLLMHLRTIICKTKEYLMVHGIEDNVANENFVKVREYFDQLLPVIVNLLNYQIKEKYTMDSNSSTSDESLEQRNVLNKY